MHNWTSRFLLGATLLLSAWMVYWILNHQIHVYDNVQHLTNALSLERLSPEPYGYDLRRPPLVTIALIPLSWLQPHVTPQKLVQLALLINIFFAGGLVWLCLKMLRSSFSHTLRTHLVIWALVANGLMLLPCVLSVIDIPAAFFAAAAALCYLTFRDTHPQRAFAGTLIFWGLSALTRWNFIGFGGIFLLEEIWRRWRHDRSLSPVRVLLSMAVVVLVSTLVFCAPYFVKYRWDFWQQLSQQMTQVDGLWDGLRTYGLRYDDMLVGALTLPMLVLSLAGLTLMWRQPNKGAARLLWLYTFYFISSLIVVVPQQYLRFLTPLLLPYAIGLFEVLRACRHRYGERGEHFLSAVMMVCTLWPLYQVSNYLNDPLFDRGPAQTMVADVKTGQRQFWYGPSLQYPFHHKDSAIDWLHPVSNIFNYAPHMLKLDTAEDVIYIQSNNDRDVHRGVDLQIDFDNPVVPDYLADRLEDGDVLVYNPNRSISYRRARPKNLKPVAVIHFSENPNPSDGGRFKIHKINLYSPDRK